MIDLNIEIIKQNLVDRLNIVSKNILINYPVSEYIELIRKYPQYVTHKFVSSEIVEITSEIINLSDVSSLENYHKLVLTNFIQLSIEGSSINVFPEDIIELFFNNFKLILKKIISPKIKKGFFLYSEDKFKGPLIMSNKAFRSKLNNLSR